MHEYFLSSYLSRPDTAEVFSIRHDQAVALWARGPERVELVRYWELERLSGQKHHYWPLFTSGRAERLITDLLAEEGVSWSDIQASWGTPGLPGYREIKVAPPADAFPMHSLAHLYSGLLMDTAVFRGETIVAMAVDAGPDVVLDHESKAHWYAGCVSQRGELTYSPVETPAQLYSACKSIFGIEDGTLMALVSACDAVVDYDIDTVVGGLEFYGGRTHPSKAAVPLVQSVIDEARRQLRGGRPDLRFSAEDNLRSAVMKQVQRACEIIATRNIERLCELAGISPGGCYLSMSGGFALNCPTNSRLLDRYGFRGLLTPPCPNDSGQALGLGLLGLYTEGHLDDREFALRHAYHGTRRLGVDEATAEFVPWIASANEFDSDVFVADLEAGPVAWVSGAAEIGPRALGHRSLLADPRSATTKDALNACKLRQWWRPVAPIVLEEFAGAWFELSRRSPFMLEAVPVRESARARVPAVCHLDGSARVQTISADADPILYAALRSFHEATGVPLLCNTSLNDKGEPIVNTAAEALNFCVRKKVAVAYLDGTRVELRPADSGVTTTDRPRERRSTYFTGQEVDRDRIWSAWHAAGYSDRALYLMSRTPELRSSEPSELSARQLDALARFVGGAMPRFAQAAARFRVNIGPGSRFDLGAYWDADH